MVSNLGMHNKASVEATPLGTYNVAIYGSSVWAEENRAQRLNDVILTLVQSTRELGIGGASILRLIVITADYPGEVARWSQELDEEWRVPSEGAVGQTLTWGNGEPDSSYSIIILAEAEAICLVEGDAELQSVATGLLIHELAHVHDDFHYLFTFGSMPPLRPGDWISIRHFIAQSTWGEFFAETAAYPYLRDYGLQDQLDHALTLLSDSRREIEQEISAFQLHQDVHRVWAVAVDKLSAVFNQFGRVLSLLYFTRVESESDERFDRFLVSTRDVSVAWEHLLHELLDELLILEERERWGDDSFDRLGEIVDQGFRIVDLEPYE